MENRKTEDYEYEMLFESTEDDFVKIDGWYPIANDMIRNPEKIEHYIATGLLRRINTQITRPTLNNTGSGEGKPRCEFELHVIDYCGLSEHVAENQPIAMDFGNLVDLVCSVTQNPKLTASQPNNELLEQIKTKAIQMSAALYAIENGQEPATDGEAWIWKDVAKKIAHEANTGFEDLLSQYEQSKK